MAPPATATGSAADFMPPTRTLPALREAAAGCRGCELWKRGTQTVFGAGSAGFERFFHAIGQKTDATEPHGVYVPDFAVMRAAGEKYWTQFMPEFQFRD